MYILRFINFFLDFEYKALSNVSFGPPKYHFYQTFLLKKGNHVKTETLSTLNLKSLPKKSIRKSVLL